MDIVINSVISGIHKTKIGANRSVELIVENDDTIPHIDPDCMVVRVPCLEDIPPAFHRAIAYPKSRNPRDPRQNDDDDSNDDSVLSSTLYQKANQKLETHIRHQRLC